MNKKKNKDFIKPEIKTITFVNEDIIVTSLGNGGNSPEIGQGGGEEETFGGN